MNKTHTHTHGIMKSTISISKGKPHVMIDVQAGNEGRDIDYESSGRTEYTLADVYDDAAVIGSELEKIITNYGSEVLKDLMPKVISVLELLENLTIKNEKENEELVELKMRINSLEYEKAQRNNEREKFEKVGE